MNLWIIEARIDGRLDLTAPQPEALFGTKAITGLTSDDMAKVIFRNLPDLPDASLQGDSIVRWPTLLDSRFIARPKTW
jgi:hypothetical protein